MFYISRILTHQNRISLLNGVMWVKVMIASWSTLMVSQSEDWYRSKVTHWVKDHGKTEKQVGKQATLPNTSPVSLSTLQA